MNLKFFSLRMLAAAMLFSFNAKAQVPSLQWVHTLGGPDYEFVSGIAVDNANNIYATGVFAGTIDIDPGTNVLNVVSSGFTDLYITKKDPVGNLIWAKSIGGAGEDISVRIKVDSTGNIFISGRFASTVDFDPGSGTFNLTCTNDTKPFILKLNSNGDFLWAKSIEPATNAWAGPGIELDNESNIYLVGSFQNIIAFYDGASYDTITANGAFDGYIAKFDSSGNYLWAASVGGADDDMLHSVVFDSAHNVYAAGYFTNTADFDPGVGNLLLTADSLTNVFFWKLNVNGGLIWAKKMLKTVWYHFHLLAIDTVGDIYMGGQFQGTVDFDPGPGTADITSMSAQPDGYIEKLTSDGDFIWVKQLGSNGLDRVSDLTVASGDVYVVGDFVDTLDIDPNVGTQNLIAHGMSDVFIGRFTDSGNLVWGGSLVSGNGRSVARAILVDSNDDIICSGEFLDTVDFDPGVSIVTNTSFLGTYDAYVVKLGQPSLHITKLMHTPSVKVYPNPAKKNVTIQYDKAVGGEMIVVYNQLGAVVHVEMMKGHSVTIDVTSWAKGTYFVRVTDGNIDVTAKLLIIE